MKLLHIASGDLWAGAEKQLFTLLVALNDLEGITVRAIILNPGTLADTLRDAGIYTYILDESRQGSLALLQAINAILASDRPDLVHTHRQKENILGGIAAALRGIPSVRTQHGSSEHPLKPGQLVRHLQRALDWGIGRFVQKKTIAVSDILARELGPRFGESRICTIPNGLNLERYPDAVSNINLDAPLRVGFAGRLVPVKRVDLFLHIAAAIVAKGANPMQFDIYGDGPLLQSLQEQATELGLNEHVRFHGHIEKSEQAIAQLDVLVICSDHEGLPMAALEAMKYHTLVLTHPIGGLPTLLGNGLYGQLAASQQVEDFTTVLQFIDGNRQLLTEKTAAAYDQLAKHYSANAMAAAHLQLYRESVGQGAHQHPAVAPPRPDGS